MKTRVLGKLIRTDDYLKKVLRDGAVKYHGRLIVYRPFEDVMECNVCGNSEGHDEDNPKKFWQSIWNQKGGMWHCKNCLAVQWFYVEELFQF